MFDVMLEPDLYVAQAMWEEGEQFKKVIQISQDMIFHSA